MSEIISFSWPGNRFQFFSKRHWNHFFDRAVFLRIRAQGSDILLRGGDGLFVQTMNEYVAFARNDFLNFEQYWNFSLMSCDLLARDKFIEPNGPDDWFNQFHATYQNDQAALLRLAKNSIGYIGPDNWDDRTPSIYRGASR